MTAPCGSFRHAFDNCSLNFVNLGEIWMMVNRQLNYTQMAINRVQIRAIRWTKCLAQ